MIRGSSYLNRGLTAYLTGEGVLNLEKSHLAERSFPDSSTLKETSLVLQQHWPLEWWQPTEVGERRDVDFSLDLSDFWNYIFWHGDIYMRSNSTLKASRSHDKSPQTNRNHQYRLVWPHQLSTFQKKGHKTDIFPVLQKLTHICNAGTSRRNVRGEVFAFPDKHELETFVFALFPSRPL